MFLPPVRGPISVQVHEKQNAEDESRRRQASKAHANRWTDHRSLSVRLQVRLAGLMTPISFLRSVLSYWTCDLTGSQLVRNRRA